MRVRPRPTNAPPLRRNTQTPRGSGQAGAVPTKAYRCDKHLITYELPAQDTPACPMCVLDSEHTELQIAYQRQANRLETMEQENARLHDQVSDSVAMRHAAELLDDGDRVFLKDVLYRWRENRSARLSTIMTAGQLRGFLMDPESGEPEARQVTSPGGLALVHLFQEASASQGGDQAMSLLARALHDHLQGAT